MKSGTTIKEAIVEVITDMGDEAKIACTAIICIMFCILGFSGCEAVSSMSPEPKAPPHESSRLAAQMQVVDDVFMDDEKEKEIILKLVEKYDPAHDRLKHCEPIDMEYLIEILKEAGIPQETIDKIEKAEANVRTGNSKDW